MKPQSQNKRLVTIVLIAGAALVVAMIATAPSSTTNSSKPPAKHSATTAPGDDQFTQKDYDAHFAKLDMPTPDVFKPLVYHAASAAGSNQPNAVPPDYANGEAGWTFTGIVGIDGAEEASFENDKTGEFAQVSKGEHWKGCSISAIGSDTVTLNGVDGFKVLPLPVEVPTAQPQTTAANNQNTPLIPPITGQIGMDESAAPAADATVDVGSGGGFGGGGFGGRRRGGRGGGGRGGGGRGGGGGGGGGFGGGAGGGLGGGG